MLCRFCRKSMPGAESAVVCSGCRLDLQWYVNKLEDKSFDITTSGRAADIKYTIEYNIIHGGYVPEWYGRYKEGVIVTDQCDQCGRPYNRFGVSHTCPTCKKLAKTWSAHLSRGIHYLESERMEQLVVMYCGRQVAGYKIPASATKLLASVTKEEYERLLRMRAVVEEANQKRMRGRITSWLNS